MILDLFGNSGLSAWLSCRTNLLIYGNGSNAFYTFITEILRKKFIDYCILIIPYNLCPGLYTGLCSVLLFYN
ncbi:MAG TPA: hypothetical protein DEQ14_03270 [Treponema sp.]|nr:hypothetical protein [Treponema sp.]